MVIGDSSLTHTSETPLRRASSCMSSGRLCLTKETGLVSSVEPWLCQGDHQVGSRWDGTDLHPEDDL